MELGLLHILISAFLLASALLVVLIRNPILSAIFLMGTLFFTGALFFSLGSLFIGAVQILVYAGAIAVLFAFILMLLDVRESRVIVPGRAVIAVCAAIIVVGFFAVSTAILYQVVSDSSGLAGHVEAREARSIAAFLITKYHVPFQVAGLLILAAIVGVVSIARTLRHEKRGVRS